MLCQFTICSIIITLCAFEAISTKDFLSVKFASRIQLVVCALVDVFIFTWKGESLFTETVKLRGRIYDSRWFNLTKDGKAYKSIRFLLVTTMMNAKETLLRAGGVFPLRLETYGDVRSV